jgi:ubiquinone/menaquinone biosynthesis C-methylase UbiE
MEFTIELLGAIVVGIFGVAQGIVAIMQIIREKKNDRIGTEQLLFDLQQELTTGETWNMINKQPADDKYLILTYERVITKFMLLKKIVGENSPAITSIIRNIHYVDNLISYKYKDSNNTDEWANIYKNARQNLISKIERINQKISVVSDFYSKKYAEIATVQTIMGKRLLKMLNFSDVKNVLDFGCGDARHSIAIAVEYPAIKVDGFDASTDLIRLANEKKTELGLSNVNFWVEDANNFYREDSYNIVLCNFVIHWVGPQCFKIISNALKEGGQFVASISGGVNGKGSTPELREVIWRKIEEFGYDKYFTEWDDKRYNPDQGIVETELRKAGFSPFRVVSEKRNNLDSPNGKSPKEIYEAELVTTLPPYYAKLHNAEERKQLYESVLSCFLEEKTPITNVDIVIQARKNVK